MCSNYEDSCDQETDLSYKGTTSPEKMCRKCDNMEACVLLRKKDSYCRNCFLEYMTQRFRATIGKAKAVGHGEKVLVGFSGGRSSVALAHLISQGLKQSEFKKLRLVPSLLYIDEGGLQGKDSENRRKVCEEVWKYARKLDMPLYMTAYESLNLTERDFNNSVWEVKSEEDLGNIYSNFNTCDTLQKLMESSRSVTTKEDVVHLLRRECLNLAAVATHHKKVLVGDTATSLAVATLSSVATGRGDQLLESVGFRESCGDGVELLRPLRELDAREVAYYNQLNELQPISVESLTTKMLPGSSIHKLSEEFVLGLQNNLPSTVPTVVRTATKLSKHTQATNLCVLCQREHKNDDPNDYTALEATVFSELISQSASPETRPNILERVVGDKPTCRSSETECCGGCSSSSRPALTSLSERVCYGCKVLMKSVDVDCFPEQILKRAKEKASSIHLREQIQEFLIEES